MLLLHHREYPLELERQIDGRLRHEKISSDQITVIPANISHEAKWKTVIEFTALILEQSAIARIAHESIDPDRVELLPHFTQPDPLISQIGLALKIEVETDGLDSSLYAESMATALSAHLLRHYSTRGHLLRDFEGLPRYKLHQATEYINEYLTENITLPELADAVGMSRYYFSRLFKQSTGLTPHQYLIQRRLEKAIQLLANTDLAIADIALQVGFASHSHLTKVFRQHLSVTPKMYRQML